MGMGLGYSVGMGSGLWLLHQHGLWNLLLHGCGLLHGLGVFGVGFGIVWAWACAFALASAWAWGFGISFWLQLFAMASIYCSTREVGLVVGVCFWLFESYHLALGFGVQV